jgi:hypothetical protein
MSEPKMTELNITPGQIARHTPRAAGAQGRDAALVDIAQDLLLRDLHEQGLLDELAFKGGAPRCASSTPATRAGSPSTSTSPSPPPAPTPTTSSNCSPYACRDCSSDHSRTRSPSGEANATCR